MTKLPCIGGIIAHLLFTRDLSRKGIRLASTLTYKEAREIQREVDEYLTRIDNIPPFG